MWRSRPSTSQESKKTLQGSAFAPKLMLLKSKTVMYCNVFNSLIVLFSVSTCYWITVLQHRVSTTCLRLSSTTFSRGEKVDTIKKTSVSICHFTVFILKIWVSTSCTVEQRTSVMVNGISNVARFNFEAFRFVQHRDLAKSTIYLHCILRLCEPTKCLDLLSVSQKIV